MNIYYTDLRGCQLPDNWDELSVLEQVKIADNSDPAAYDCIDGYIEACGFDIYYTSQMYNYFGSSLDPDETDAMFIKRNVAYTDILNDTNNSFLQQRDDLRDDLRETFGKAKRFKVHNRYNNSLNNIQVYYKDGLINNQYQQHLVQDYIDANYDTHTSLVCVENRHGYLCFTFYMDIIC